MFRPAFAAMLVFGALISPHGEAAEPRCGAYCLYVALRGLDFSVPSYAEFEKSFDPPSDSGYNLAQLSAIAEKYGARTLGVQTKLDRLGLRKQPIACVALLSAGHFVLVSDYDDRDVTIIDPPRANTIPRDTLGVGWNGEALLISPEPLAREEDLKEPRSKVWWTALGGAVALLIGLVWTIRGRRRGAAQALVMAVLLPFAVGCAKPPATATAAGSAPVGPAIQVAQSSVDLGYVSLSPHSKNVSFEIKNAGTAPLQVKRLVPSCGCAGVTPIHKPIAPGASTPLRVALDCSVPGRRSARISIESNDPVAPEIYVLLHWEPAGRFVFSPAKIEFGVVPLYATRSANVILRPAEGVDKDHLPAIAAVLCTPQDRFSCDTEADGEGEYQFRVSLNTGSRAENVDGSILVRLEDSDFPECVLPVHFRVAAPVEVQPSSLYLNSGPPGEAASGSVVISATDGSPLEIDGATFAEDPGNGGIEVLVLAENRRMLRISYQRPEAPGVHRDRMIVRVTQPVTETLHIPVVLLTNASDQEDEHAP